jgi:hypothetical protein
MVMVHCGEKKSFVVPLSGKAESFSMPDTIKQLHTGTPHYKEKKYLLSIKSQDFL